MAESEIQHGVRCTDFRPHTISYVWNVSGLALVAMTQPLLKTDSLTVSGTMDLSKIGGVAVGATNALYVQPGTGADFPLPTAQVTTLTPPPAITGFATSAKQLLDGHNVVVTSIPAITGSVTQGSPPWTVDITKVAGELIQVSGGAEEKAIRVTLASDSTGLISVDDNAGSLTVDGSVEVKGLVSAELTSGEVGATVPLSLTTDRQLRVVSYIAPTYINFFGDFDLGKVNNFGSLEGYLEMKNHPWAGV